jgi:hypothetical protein
VLALVDAEKDRLVELICRCPLACFSSVPADPFALRSILTRMQHASRPRPQPASSPRARLKCAYTRFTSGA